MSFGTSYDMNIDWGAVRQECVVHLFKEGVEVGKLHLESTGRSRAPHETVADAVWRCLGCGVEGTIDELVPRGLCPQHRKTP